MIRLMFAATLLLSAAACATAAKYTLDDRFQAIGISPDNAACMVDRLDDTLTNDEINDLARYTLRVRRAPSTAAAIEELLKFDNARVVAEVGKAGFSCVTGFGR